MLPREAESPFESRLCGTASNSLSSRRLLLHTCQGLHRSQFSFPALLGLKNESFPPDLAVSSPPPRPPRPLSRRNFLPYWMGSVKSCPSLSSTSLSLCW